MVRCRPDEPDVVATLDSLAIQDLDPTLFEVIVLWQGYSHTPVQQYAEQYNYRIEHVHQAHPNEASAFNLAIRAASSPWVVFFDAGTILGQQTLRHHLHGQASSLGHTVLVGQRQFVPAIAGSPAAKLVYASGVWFPEQSLSSDLDAKWRHLYFDNVSVPRANLLAIGGFDQSTFDGGTCPPLNSDFDLKVKWA